MQQQQEFIAMLLEKLSMNMNIRTESSNPPEPKPFPESLIQQISEFLFDRDAEVWGHISSRPRTCSGAQQSQTTLAKIRHCWTQEVYKFYSSEKVEDISFEETVLYPSKLFSEQCSKFRICNNCLTVNKRDDEDWMNYVSCINSDFEKSNLSLFLTIFSNVFYLFAVWEMHVLLTFVLESWNLS